jgi:hypothetical protein
VTLLSTSTQIPLSIDLIGSNGKLSEPWAFFLNHLESSLPALGVSFVVDETAEEYAPLRISQGPAISRASDPVQGALFIAVDTGETFVESEGAWTLQSPALTGDVLKLAGSSETELAEANVAPGTFGSATVVPVVTVDAKGRTTSVGLADVVADAGTLIGPTLAAGVTGSSLEAVGVLTAGSWESDPVAVAFGGTGQSTAPDALNALLPAQPGEGGKFLRTDGSSASWAAAAAGTVTSVSVVSANGLSGSVANATTTPAITLTAGALTPTSVAASGAVTGSNLSGTNTGDTTVTGTAGQVTSTPGIGNNFTLSLPVPLAVPGSLSAAGTITSLGGNMGAEGPGNVQFYLTSTGGANPRQVQFGYNNAGGIYGYYDITAPAWSVYWSITDQSMTVPSTTASVSPWGGALKVLGGVGVLGALNVQGAIAGSNLSGTNTGDQTSVTGNAGSATVLQTARTINGVSFNGSANVTVPAAAGTLTGATLASGVTASSLTSLGTLGSLTVSGNVVLGDAQADTLNVGNGDIIKDAAGNVGLGVSPSGKLDVYGNYMLLRNGTYLGYIGYGLLLSGGLGAGNLAIRSDGGAICLGLGASEKWRFDGNGNFGIGTTGPGNYGAGYQSMAINGSTAGVYDLFCNNVRTATWYAISTEVRLMAVQAVPLTLWTGSIERLRIDTSGHTTPGADGAQTLGSAAKRWSTVYATTGAINTSDLAEKAEVRELSKAESDVAKDLKRMVKAFKYKGAIAAKGEGNARLHVGLVAQDVRDAFARHGLDGFKYGLLCRDELTNEDGTKTERYGLRYEELMCFLWSAS